MVKTGFEGSAPLTPPDAGGPGDRAGEGAGESAGEAAAFRTLQGRFADQFREVFEDDALARTIVVLPSLSLDAEVLGKITGVIHYEQRLLCHLLLMRLPRGRSSTFSTSGRGEASWQESSVSRRIAWSRGTPGISER
ncbi:MAG: hypothetical protein AAFR52_18545 [Pseudomonadota bacterium]